MFNLFKFLSISGIFGFTSKKHYKKAEAYFDEKKYDEAIVEYEKILKNDKNNFDVLVKCAETYFFNIKFSIASEYYLRAIELRPNYAKAYNNLGNLSVLEGDREKAKKEYKKALEIDPNYNSAQYNLDHFSTIEGDLCDNLGIDLQKRGEYLKAIDFHQKAIDCGTTFPAKSYNNLGYAYYNLNDFDNAIIRYDEALKIDPNLSNAIKFREKALNKKIAVN